jgi:hypothetical protein
MHSASACGSVAKHEVEARANGIRLKEQWFFSQSADMGRLGRLYRVMFRRSSSIQIAQRTQRPSHFLP